MINAKNKFKEGFIMLNRPFYFAKLKNPIQKLTIVYAYSEQSYFEKILSKKAKTAIDDLYNQCNFMNKERFINESIEEFKNRQLESIFESSSSYEELYKGDIVQVIIDNETCRFYPEEYTIMSKEKITEIMQEEGYHAIVSPGIEKIKGYQDSLHYLKSRGISERIAKKWAGLSFKEFIYFKPYYELLTMFCRPHEIYPDDFYREIEGIVFNELNVQKDKTRKAIVQLK